MLPDDYEALDRALFIQQIGDWCRCVAVGLAADLSGVGHHFAWQVRGLFKA